jgi:hypothetical protein
MWSKENMNAAVRPVFDLVVRLIGLVFLYQGLASVPMAVMNFCPSFPHFNWRSLWPSFFLTVWPLLVGYWFVRGAPQLMRVAFPPESEPPSA